MVLNFFYVIDLYGILMKPSQNNAFKYIKQYSHVMKHTILK